MLFSALVGLVAFGQIAPLSDPALEKQISVRADAEPIHTVVARIGKETGVKVFANSAVGQDRIILFAKDLPAKDILKKISDHFEWDWRLTKDGLELWQTPGQKVAEGKALQLAILTEMRRWRQQSIVAMKTQQGRATKEESERLRALAEQTVLQLEKYRDEYYGTPEQRRAWSEKQRKIVTESTTLSRKVSPSWQLYDHVVAELSDNELLLLESLGKLTIAYAPKGTQRPMSKAAQRKSDVVLNSLVVDSVRTGVEREFGKLMNVGANSEFSVEGTRNLKLHLSVIGPPILLRRGMPVASTGTLVVVDSELNRTARLGFSDRPVNSVPPRRQTDEKVDPDQKRDRLDEPLEANEALKNALTIDSGTGLAKIQKETLERFLTLAETTFRSHGTAVVLNELACSAKVNFISDCYEVNRLDSIRTVNLATPRRAFQTLAKSNNEEFAFDRDWVSFRDPNPAIGRAYSIPSDALLAMRDALLQPFTLETSAKAISLLTDRQIETNWLQTETFARWGFPLRSRDKTISLLRFWAAMSPGAKRTLLTGKPVLLSSLSKACFEHLWTFLDAQTNDFDGAQNFGPTTDKADYEWSKENWGSNENFRRDRDLNELFPNGIHPQASISFRQSQGWAVSRVRDGRSSTLRRSAYAMLVGGYIDPQKDENGYQLTPEERSLFTFNLDSGMKRGFALIGFGKPSDQVFQKFVDLPRELRVGLEEDLRLRRGGSQ